MPRMSEKTDKYVLYKRSVQDPQSEIYFFNRVFKKHRGKTPLVLREDFCGTATVACEWVRSQRERRAYGIDLHGPTLKWGEKQHVASLGKAASRVKLIQGNVLDQHGFKPQIVAALNFSYFTFKDRATMLDYARAIYLSLAKDGIFVLDIFGGPGAQEVSEEETDHSDFVYIWDQAAYNPVTGEIKCYIHFRFPNGKEMRRAFVYDWRLWTIPEMTDILKEVGFKKIEVYWEGTDEKTGEGNGSFRPTKRGDDAESWVSYIVAVK